VGIAEYAVRSFAHLFGLFAVLASGVLGANMGCKCPFALQLMVPHHFIKGIARGRGRIGEHPRAFGAAPTRKMVLFDPNELAYRHRNHEANLCGVAESIVRRDETSESGVEDRLYQR
jgi:hypothetical protein